MISRIFSISSSKFDSQTSLISMVLPSTDLKRPLAVIGPSLMWCCAVSLGLLLLLLFFILDRFLYVIAIILLRTRVNVLFHLRSSFIFFPPQRIAHMGVTGACTLKSPMTHRTNLWSSSSYHGSTGTNLRRNSRTQNKNGNEIFGIAAVDKWRNCQHTRSIRQGCFFQPSRFSFLCCDLHILFNLCFSACCCCVLLRGSIAIGTWKNIQRTKNELQ